MNIQAEKLDIIQWLAKVDDSKIIKQFMLLKRSNEEGTSINLSREEKESIDKGIQAINEGRFKSHEEVTEATKKKYTRLFKQ
jgi:predicted transcriptional regulator